MIRTAPARRRGVAGVALAGLVVIAVAAFSVSVMVSSGFVTAGTSSSCVTERCNATARGDQVMELSGRQVAVSGIGDGRATFEVDGDRVELAAGEARQVGGSLISLTSVDGDVTTFSIDFSGLFDDRADLEPVDDGLTPADDRATPADDYTPATDDQEVITVELPARWDDIDSTENPDVGPVLQAAEDLPQFRDTWDVPGVIVEVWPGLGRDDADDMIAEIGPRRQCTAAGRRSFDDPPFSGIITRWSDCGGGSTEVIVAAVAAEDGGELVTVYGQALDARDSAAIDHALATIEIDGAGADTVASLTDEEWAAAIESLRVDLEREILDLGNDLTPSVMSNIADVMDTCGTELEEIGRPGDDLDQASSVAERACGQYDRGARCFRRAARIGYPQELNGELRRQGRAIDCGLNAWTRGEDLLSRAAALAE